MLHVKSLTSSMSFAILQVQLTVTGVQNVIEKIYMLSVVIQAFKKSVMFICTHFPK